MSINIPSGGYLIQSGAFEILLQVMLMLRIADFVGLPFLDIFRIFLKYHLKYFANFDITNQTLVKFGLI